MFDRLSGLIEVSVILGSRLGVEQRSALIEKLSLYSGKTVRLKINTDSTIQGGFIAKLGDTVFDGSIKTQLERMKLQLARG